MCHLRPLFISIIILTTVSCEKEIEIDVENAHIRPVIEAKISNHSGDAVAVLTYSQNLQDNQVASPITDAQVFIEDLTNNTTHTFVQEQEGMYYHPSLAGEIGHKYQLKVVLADGSIHTSMAIMPELIPLIDVKYQLADEALQDDDEEEKLYEIIPEFVDLAGIDNYYQLEIKEEQTNKIDLNVFKDLGFDGLDNTQRVYTNANPQDSLNISLHNLDKPAYDYLYGMLQNINQTSGTPTNPISNISGNALGYFKVYSYNEAITIVIP